MEPSNYPVICVLPEDIVYEYSVSSSTLQKSVNGELWKTLINQYLVTKEILCYRKMSDGSMKKEYLSAQDIGNRYGFTYIPFLKFYLAADVRNLWLNEMKTDFEFGNWQIEQNTSSFKAISADEFRIYVSDKLTGGFYYPSVSIRPLGMIEGCEIGYGLFAEDEIPAYQYLGEYVGIVSSQGFVEKNGFSDHLSYCCEYPSCDGGMLINAEEEGNIVRFINHSESPNCMFMRYYVDGLSHILCFTIKPIPKDDQITVNYGPSYWMNKSYDCIKLS